MSRRLLRNVHTSYLKLTEHGAWKYYLRTGDPESRLLHDAVANMVPYVDYGGATQVIHRTGTSFFDLQCKQPIRNTVHLHLHGGYNPDG